MGSAGINLLFGYVLSRASGAWHLLLGAYAYDILGFKSCGGRAPTSVGVAGGWGRAPHHHGHAHVQGDNILSLVTPRRQLRRLPLV